MKGIATVRNILARINWARITGLVLCPAALWIGLFWAPIWTALLLLICFSVMAFAAAWERGCIAQERKGHPA